MCVVPLLAFAACDDDAGVNVQGPPPPQALVRFINTVTDTGTVDFRFVDRVENLPTLQGVAFRSHSGMYQRAEPGARAARIFPNATDPALTSIFLVDETINLAADTRYTLLYAGRANASAPAAERHRLTVIQDPPAPTPPAGQIAIKVLHAAVGTGNVDVYIVPVDTTNAPTPADFATNNAGVAANVAYLAQSGYVNVPVRPSSPRLPLYRFVVTPAGATNVLFAATPNQPGAASTVPTAGPQPGVQIAGSALTAVVAPGSTAGTRQSTTANQTPTVFFIPDKVLNP